MKPVKIAANLMMAFALLGGAPGLAQARITRAWTYAELFAGADLVVIATPSATHQRKEQAELPGIVQTSPDKKSAPVIGQRIETTFKVLAVLKGLARDETGGTTGIFYLHHYSEIGPSLNGPLHVSFDPKAKLQYLMFLKRGFDGQYIAVSGQTDPWFSIEPLRERAR